MAKMIPAILQADTRSSAERRLFPILRDSLDDGYTVFHSFDLLGEDDRGRFIDGEIDYLIFNPDNGFLILEVKGGAILYNGGEGIWYQNEKPMKSSPFKQAKDSKYKLRGFLKKKLGHIPRCAFAHAVCFPDVHTEMDGLPSGADAGICICGHQLDRIGKLVPDIISHFSEGSSGRIAQKEEYQIRQVIMPHCEYGTSLLDRIGQAEQEIFRLTETQCRMLDFIRCQRKALIEGCAGSGKTIMALKKTRELALEGKSVLLLAYNVMIGQYLAESVSDLENVTACNYHRFCMDCLNEAGVSPGQDYGPEFWTYQVPDAFEDLLKKHPLKYDAVIVDEGQDFHAQYWVTITELLEDDGYFYIFYDPEQNLFGGDLTFPIDKNPFVLDDNCRNTRSIFNKLENYSKKEMHLFPGAPGGESVVELTARDKSTMRRKLGKILYDLANHKGLPGDRIVILGGHSIHHTCIGDNPAIGEFRITENVNEDGPNVIHYHTYMKFKGCEADAVIIIDVDRNDDRWAVPEAMYTAVSRARHLLYILYIKGENDAG